MFDIENVDDSVHNVQNDDPVDEEQEPLEASDLDWRQFASLPLIFFVIKSNYFVSIYEPKKNISYKK